MPSQPQLLREELSEDTGHKTLSSGEADRLERWDQVERAVQEEEAQQDLYADELFKGR